MKQFAFVFVCLFVIFPLSAFSANRVVDLHVGYKVIQVGGAKAQVIAINHQMPGPTLHFKQGDNVTINVHNDMQQPTSMHWHGIILPWNMDGVAWVSQKPIPPGGVFHYKFKLRQYGTYWYHSHYKLQEQEGQYGAIVIDPADPKRRVKADEDFVIQLGDWIDTDGEQVFRNLKKTGDFYSVYFPLKTSLAQFVRLYHHADKQQRHRLWHTFNTMQKTRMGVYDISDIAYQNFFINGHTNKAMWKKRVHVGDTVRLRVIGSGASTYFHVKVPGSRMQVIAMDGSRVKPIWVSSFLIGPGETYDVLVKIERNRPYPIYAEATSTIGAAVGLMMTQPSQSVDVKSIKPFPRPSPRVMQPIMPPSVPVKQYQNLQADQVTNDPNQPVHVIHMKLSGYMERYMWFINGKELYYAKPVMLKKGQRYRIVFTNATLMHHPMHIHGHWFIYQNGHGAHNPLMHTVDVPPAHTVTVDFIADASGQWFFHCHNLYHVDAGMGRILRYQSNSPSTFKGLNGPSRPLVGMTQWQMLGDFINDDYQTTLKSLWGSDYNKILLLVKDAEMTKGTLDDANADLFYYRTISQFWAVKFGLNAVFRPTAITYYQPGFGIEGTMPYFIDTDLRFYDYAGAFKADMEFSRNTLLVDKLFFDASFRLVWATKNLPEKKIGTGLNYYELTFGPAWQFTPHIALTALYDRTQYYGNTLGYRFAEGEKRADNNFYVGLNLLF